MGDLSKGIADVGGKTRQNMELLCAKDQMAQCYLNAECRKGIAWMYRYGTFIMRGPMKAPAQRRSWKQIQGAVYKADLRRQQRPVFRGRQPVSTSTQTRRSARSRIGLARSSCSSSPKASAPGWQRRVLTLRRSNRCLARRAVAGCRRRWYTDLSLVTRDRNVRERDKGR